MSASEKTDPRIWACAFVLADANEDEAGAQTLLREVAAGKVGTVEAIVVLARMAAAALELASGEEWREHLNVALLGLSVDEEPGS